MNRNEVLLAYAQAVKILKAPANKALLTAGAAMVVLGLRENTSGIDLGVASYLFKKAKDKYGSSKVEKGDLTLEIVYIPMLYTGQSDDVIAIHDRGDIKGERINGVFMYPVKEILAQKKAMRRYKDIADIGALETYLNKKEVKTEVQAKPEVKPISVSIGDIYQLDSADFPQFNKDDFYVVTSTRLVEGKIVECSLKNFSMTTPGKNLHDHALVNMCIMRRQTKRGDTVVFRSPSENNNPLRLYLRSPTSVKECDLVINGRQIVETVDDHEILKYFFITGIDYFS